MQMNHWDPWKFFISLMQLSPTIWSYLFVRAALSDFIYRSLHHHFLPEYLHIGIRSLSEVICPILLPMILFHESDPFRLDQKKSEIDSFLLLVLAEYHLVLKKKINFGNIVTIGKKNNYLKKNNLDYSTDM